MRTVLVGLAVFLFTAHTPVRAEYFGQLQEPDRARLATWEFSPLKYVDLVSISYWEVLTAPGVKEELFRRMEEELRTRTHPKTWQTRFEIEQDPRPEAESSGVAVAVMNESQFRFLAVAPGCELSRLIPPMPKELVPFLTGTCESLHPTTNTVDPIEQARSNWARLHAIFANPRTPTPHATDPNGRDDAFPLRHWLQPTIDISTTTVASAP